ncbi:phage nucleotide-binding protein [Paucilactobacillus vaccinostercus DSM 20634]|uniref:Phage nucleotide-binding protein n=1 Tax=Paucilactobacillus vaccinostercus DSM 20634 TaxID=1423813 RepID=A0A0R2A3Q3_9LACO|nr:AAA family ATPase [Paucilactobacillus vaccinostercus]KRM62078.1 phage nucleotide-binding protein [Paucilactobacillus vaccinostercus DSM 20634]
MEITNAKNIKRNKSWRVIIYSKPGIGKTSSIKYLKGKTLVLDLDNSAKVLEGLDIDVIEFDRSKPEEELVEFLKQAPELAKQYDNLVIDNISSLEKDWFVEKGRKSHNGISNELQDYSQWTNYFARIMITTYSLKDINILTTAWETQNDVTTETGQTFSQYAPQIRKSVRDGLLGMADVVGRVVVNPKTNGRGVILQGDDSIFAKNRLDNRKLTPIEELFDFGKKPEPKVEKKEGTK